MEDIKRPITFTAVIGIQVYIEDQQDFWTGTPGPAAAAEVIHYNNYYMKSKLFTTFLLLLTSFLFGQDTTFTAQEMEINKYVQGTLLIPNEKTKPPLVIMLQGSGPTDRNGNQSFMKNDSFKKLAKELAEEGIASFRYDKRILLMPKLGIKEEEMRFDDFIKDASTVIDHFKEQDRFSDLVVLGHSQGSLVGMVAAKGKADAFISIAGVAQPIDSIITQQIANQMPGLKQSVQQTFAELHQNGSSTSYNPVLESIFRPSVQPFILSWMKYNPQEEISKLDIPVLLINGSSDLQVEVSEAEKLKEAYPDSELIILDKMNHVFRKIEGDQLVNSKSYNEPGLPLHPDLTSVITNFIKGLK